MDRRADRAKAARLVRRMLIWALLGRGRLGRRRAGDGGVACQLFEMDVSARKDELQRHRCKREPSAPPPIGTNPTHWQNAPTPRLEQCTAEAIRGNAFSLKTSLPSVNLARLLPECNSHRRTRIAFCIEEFFGSGNGLTAGNTTLAVLHSRGGLPLRRSRQRRQQRPAYIDQFHPILKQTVDAAVEPMFWFCWFAPRCTCRDSDEPHSSPCALRLSASTSHPAWRAARDHGHCIDGERRGR